MKKLALVNFSGIMTVLVFLIMGALILTAYGDALNDALYTVLHHKVAALVAGIGALVLTIIFTEDI